MLRELLIDSYANDYGAPPSDEEFGGTTDIVISAWDNLLYVYTWRRLIDSEDFYDKVYVKVDSYMLLLACGEMILMRR